MTFIFAEGTQKMQMDPKNHMDLQILVYWGKANWNHPVFLAKGFWNRPSNWVQITIKSGIEVLKHK